MGKSFTVKDIPNLPIGIHCYERGVYLRVTAKSRAWIYKYSLNGKRRELGLGAAKGQSIMSVLKKANEAKGLVACGEDPIDARRKEDPALANPFDKREEIEGMTFAQLADEAFPHICQMRQFIGKDTEASWWRTIKSISKQIGDMDIRSVDRTVVAEVLKSVWYTSPRTSRDWRSRLHAVLGYAVSKGYIKENPATWKDGLDMELPAQSKLARGKPVAHHAALTAEQLKTVAARLWKSDDTGALCMLFGILTAGRSNEYRSALWSEINLEDATLTVPPARRKDKKGEPFIVPLTRQCLAILRRLDTTGEFVFVSPRGGAYNACTLLKRLNEASPEQCTAHGCRSTFSDWCVRNEKNFVVSEKCLMHAVGTSVFQAYQRDDLLPQRRKLMQEWADYLLPEVG